MNDAIADAVYASGWSVVQRLPKWAARRQFDTMADGVWLRGGPTVRRLRANLVRVVPDASRRELNLLTREAVRSYLRYWCEVFQLPNMTTEELVASLYIEGEESLRASARGAQGTILALPHMGNWDLAGAWLAGTGVPFTTVAERLRPESLFERFVAFRESLGMEVIPLTGGQSPPFAILADRLRVGGVLCLLADRDLTASGIDVDFFGSPARMPAGPAALACETGAALIPVTGFYPDRKRWGLRVHDAIPVPAQGDRASKVVTMTQQVADIFAAAISDHPADWHMLQRVWRADLDPSRVPVACGSAWCRRTPGTCQAASSRTSRTWLRR